MAIHMSKKIKEGIIETGLFLCALSSVLITISIVIVLGYESYGFFKVVSFKEFLTEKEWTPLFFEPKFGILPLVTGTPVDNIHRTHRRFATRFDGGRLFE